MGYSRRMFEPAPLPPEAPQGDDDSPSADDGFQPSKGSICTSNTCDGSVRGVHNDHSAGSIACIRTSTPIALPGLHAQSHPPPIGQSAPSCHSALQLQGMAGASTSVAETAAAAAATEAAAILAAP